MTNGWGEAGRPPTTSASRSTVRFIHFVHFNQYPPHILMPVGNIYLYIDPPEGSVGVCAYLVVEVEERMELVIVEDVVQEVGVLVTGLGQAVDVVKTVKHQTHSGVGYFVLSHLIAIVTTANRGSTIRLSFTLEAAGNISYLSGSLSNMVHLGELTAASTAPFSFRLALNCLSSSTVSWR